MSVQLNNFLTFIVLTLYYIITSMSSQHHFTFIFVITFYFSLLCLSFFFRNMENGLQTHYWWNFFFWLIELMKMLRLISSFWFFASDPFMIYNGHKNRQTEYEEVQTDMKIQNETIEHYRAHDFYNSDHFYSILPFPDCSKNFTLFQLNISKVGWFRCKVQ